MDIFWILRGGSAIGFTQHSRLLKQARKSGPLWPGICVRYFFLFPQKTCYQRKLRQTKCLLFNFWMIKLTKTLILPNWQVPNGLSHRYIYKKNCFKTPNFSNCPTFPVKNNSIPLCTTGENQLIDWFLQSSFQEHCRQNN